MTYHDDGQACLHLGDCREVLRELPAESVQMCVTSPPYWSLRDYGIEPSVWGGDAECEHDWGEAGSGEGYTGTARWQHSSNGRGEEQPTEKRLRDPITRETRPEAWTQVQQGSNCARCGAWRGALGLEPTPDLYVEHIVEVFREVRRVLRKDGTLWLNIGDSYGRDFKKGGSGPGGKNGYGEGYSEARGQIREQLVSAGVRALGSRSGRDTGKPVAGGLEARMERLLPNMLKSKDLVGIPWMVAFALRADGWWLRQDIIWAKPNPMPESVTDRCTRAHEYLFLLSKSERYYYDAAAIREPSNGVERDQIAARSLRSTDDQKRAPTDTVNGIRRSGNKERVYRVDRDGPDDHLAASVPWEGNSRNKRDVWTIPTSPFAGAHFATYPPALVEPCIFAGAREGDMVLDPFLGSGTTAMVAKKLGRRAIGIDASAEYLEIAVRRCAQMGLVAHGHG